MIPTRLIVFCKLAIVSFGMGFNKNFRVRGPNVGVMKGTKKIGENEDGEACDSTLQIPHADSRKMSL